MPQDFQPTTVTRARTDRPAASASPAASRPRGYLFDDRIYQMLRELGLTVRIEFDVEEWKQFILATEWPVVNVAADPACHDFSAGEVFWMRLTHGEETVATQVFRMITTDDYLGMIRDHSLFFGDKPSGWRDFRMLDDGKIPMISGLVTMLSGLYIKPSWRRVRTRDGQRLVAAWARLTHSFTARNLMADWSVSLLEDRLATPRMIEDLYGYPNSAEVFEAYTPDLGYNVRATLVWMSAEELGDSVARLPRSIAPRGRHPSYTAG